MRVLILGLNYLPETTSIGPYTADLAEYLRHSGHDVRVVTAFPTAPYWRVWDGYTNRLFMRDVINDVPVLRTCLYVPKNPKNILKRILFDTSFAISALVGGFLNSPCDIVVVISPPLQLGVVGWLLGKMWKAPVFFHIQDIVPDAGVATGMLKERGAAIVLARRLERFVYSKASMIGVICDGFKLNLLAKGIPSNKVVILPDYVDLDYMHLHDRNNNFRLEHGIGPNDFVVMYSGSIGLKQGLETLVEAASELRNYKDILFIILGEGPSLSELRTRAKQINLGNLRFLPLQPRDGLPQQLAAADVLVITQRREMTAYIFPGKLLYYMAASRPILAAVNQDSETGRFVQRKQVGLVVPPEDPKALAKAILDLRQDRGRSFGENGRRLAETQFDRRIVLDKFTKQLMVLTG